MLSQSPPNEMAKEGEEGGKKKGEGGKEGGLGARVKVESTHGMKERERWNQKGNKRGEEGVAVRPVVEPEYTADVTFNRE